MKLLRSVILLLLALSMAGEGKASPADSLSTLLHDAQGEARVSVLRQLARTFIYEAPDSALGYVAEGIALARQLDLMEVEETLSIYEAIIYRDQERFDSAKVAYERAYALSRKLNDPDKTVRALTGLGIVAYCRGELDEALTQQFEALKYEEEVAKRSLISSVYGNIGNVYYDLKEYDKAVAYHQKSYTLSKQIGNKGQVARNLNNLGLVYFEQKNYPEALRYFRRSLAFKEKIGNASQIAHTHNNVGMAFTKLGNYTKALYHFHKGIEINKDEDRTAFRSSVYLNIGDLYTQEGQLDLAEPNYRESLALAREAQDLLQEREAHRALSEHYETTGRLRQALTHYRQFTVLKDSILNAEKTMQIATVETRFGVRAKEKQIKILQKEREIQSLQLEWRQTILSAALIVTILLICLVSVVYSRYRYIRRTSQRLHEKNQQISDQHEQIESQYETLKHARSEIERKNGMLQAYNELLEKQVEARDKELTSTYQDLVSTSGELDSFMYRASHDLKGPIATMQGLCSVAEIDTQDPRALNYFRLLGKTANKMNNALSRMLMVDMVRKHEISLQEINLRETIEKIVQRCADRIAEAHADVQIAVDPGCTTWADALLVESVLLCLMENALIFRSEEVTCRVKIAYVRTEEGKEVLRVTDNGVGIPKEISHRVFEMFYRGSERSKGSGLGLYVAQMAAHKMESDLVYHTEMDDTTFDLVLGVKDAVVVPVVAIRAAGR